MIHHSSPDIHPSNSSELLAPRNPVRKLLAALTAAALIGVGGAKVAKELNDEPAVSVGSEAGEVALRYDCTVAEVVDTQMTPDYSMPGTSAYADLEARTVLDVDLDFTIRDGAKPVLEKYKSDDTVVWFEPHVNAITVEPGTDPEQALPMRYAPAVAFDDLHPAIQMYPKTTYPDGTRMTVYVENRVMTPFQDDEVITWYKGKMPCGVLELQQGIWTKSSHAPDFEPLVDVYESETITSSN